MRGVLWERLVIVILAISMVIAAGYAVYTSNRIYAPIEPMRTNSLHEGREGLPMSPPDETQPADSSTVQLQTGSGAQQSDSRPPQDASDYNNYPPGCGSNKYLHPEMICADLNNN